MNRVTIQPHMLRWACERAGVTVAEIGRQVKGLAAWERGEKQPTLKQLEDFAKATHTPVGYLFLNEPPVEQIPIQDFRTLGSARIGRPSPDLLDTIYLCQQRQEWYRDFARSTGESPVAFIGSATIRDDVAETAARIRGTLGLDVLEGRKIATWSDALRRLIELTDAAGVLVMVSGVVGSNNKRRLDPEEFRGFALADPLAPLVFVNGSDSRSAQMFTLAHELAHLWLGESALSDVSAKSASKNAIEIWCNHIAAEVLVPLAVFRAEYNPDAELHDELKRLARIFKVSTLVILRRMRDAGALFQEVYWTAYEKELAGFQGVPKGSGGDFYLTLGARVSKRFARALVSSAWEGRASFTEAFRLLGFKKMSTFQELSRSLEVRR